MGIYTTEEILYALHSIIEHDYLTDKYNKEDKIENIISIVDKNSSTDKDLLLNLKKGLQDIVNLIEKHNN